MAAPQTRAQTVVPFFANATLSAYRVVRYIGSNTVGYVDTTTSHILGITTQDSQGGTGSSIAVAIAGTAKVACAASVSSGSLVTAQSATASGLIMEVGASQANTTSSAIPKILGIALAAGSTNSVIEVLIQPNNQSKIAF